jgi:DNA invertase Pin-like site-specific DNA recombinase
MRRQTRNNFLQRAKGGTRAAVYIRMSTDHQRYSVLNQANALGGYAVQRGLSIIDAYADEGKSGLTFRGRPALRQLIVDVQIVPRPFDVLLVLDISRWGRFQNSDEAAYYEFICTLAGVEVVYAAEGFANDTSSMSAMLKGMRRVMAADYSRDLSRRITAGKLVRSKEGMHMGGKTPYALQRVVYRPDGKVRHVLARGERKSFVEDDIRLAPGLATEVRVVRQIFRWFASDDRPEQWIACKLNQRGVPSPKGTMWSACGVRSILTNEAYVGTVVYNRWCHSLKQQPSRHPVSSQVRCRDAFAAIVPMRTFAAAAEVFARRPRLWTDAGMLKGLAELYQRHGRVSRDLIDADTDLPKASSYAYRFDSMLRAYRLAGVPASRNFKFEQVLDAEKLAPIAITGPLRVDHFSSHSGGRGTGAVISRPRTPKPDRR